MAVPFSWLAREALDAKLHLQLAIEDVAIPSETPGAAIVSGEVVRVFRGEKSLLGSKQRLAIDVCRPDDNIPPSGILWTQADDLARAVVVEAYVDPGADGVLRVAGSQSALLAAASDAPTMVITEEDTLEPPPTPPSPLSLRDRLVGWFEGAFVLTFFALGLLGFAFAAWHLLR